MIPHATYLDHNATGPLRAEAAAAMTEAMGLAGNPSSVHGFGRDARALVERARNQVAAAVNARLDEVVFTSGGTEANAIALLGAPVDHILVSSIEHESVLSAVPDAILIPVSGEGVVDLEALERLLAVLTGRALVSVMAANNETGVLQPIREIAEITARRGALLHSDAVQALGRLPIDFGEGGVDMMTLSGHKVGGPAGVGALIVRDGLGLRARTVGGGQERGRRAGTENRIGIAGFGAAAELAVRELASQEAIGRLRDIFETRLKEAAPELRILSSGALRLANTSCVSMPGVAAETQVMALDLAGIAVSAGAACSSGKVKRSHVIEAMDPGSDDAATAVRVSFGPENTVEEVERLLNAWLTLYRRASKGRTGSAAA